MSLPKITLGCDPELFVQNEAGEVVSAWGMIPGDKHTPHKVPDGAIQVDGMAVEFNIDPVSTKDEWMGKIGNVMSHLRCALPPGHKLMKQPVVDFSPEYWATLPDEAKVLGCDPDYNAYTGEQNPRPDGAPLWRGAGGHIHIGWTSGKSLDDPDHKADCIEVVKQLDFFVGLPALLWDKDSRRKQMYGQPGAFRYKPYGVEYRSPSNQWLLDPYLTGFVFDATMAGVADLFDGNAMRVNQGNTWAQDFMQRGKGRTDVLDVMRNSSKRFKDLDTRGLARFCENLFAPKMPHNIGGDVEIAREGLVRKPLLDRFNFRGRRVVDMDLGQLEEAINFVMRPENVHQMPGQLMVEIGEFRDRLIRNGGQALRRAPEPVRAFDMEVQVAPHDWGRRPMAGQRADFMIHDELVNVAQAVAVNER